LTNNYEIPEGACTTFQVSLGELKEFEEDLHKHVHLENNHLFPKAISMMEEMEVTNK
jgi:regulator of cell morphogenesis and NO signaling